MWSYYGAKTNIIHLYPPPKYGKIIEPFAGTARYALRYWDRDILLVDKYDVIIKIWKWLQQCSPNDILKLPKLMKYDSLHCILFDCEEAKMFMGYVVAFGMAKPNMKVTRHIEDRPNFINFTLKKVAASLFKIKHWKIEIGDYANIQNQEATWFIDPPYQFGGVSYAHNNKKIDFDILRNWCLSRAGRVIVCESTKANWMKFIPVSKNKSGRGKINHEAMWTNLPTSYSIKQKELF